jgi:hypothetical protein
VRISQLLGVRPGALCAETHLIVPLLERLQLFDVRDRRDSRPVRAKDPQEAGPARE